MIYLSGPITNDPNYMGKFAAAEEMFLSMGIEVFNPTRNILLFTNIENPKYEWYMDLCLTQLRWCDSIYMLEGWENSKGAKAEYAFAICNNKKVYLQSERHNFKLFPVMTTSVQRSFERFAIESGGKFVPPICGQYGRACRQLGKEEGANRALCDGCSFKNFAQNFKRIIID